MPKDFFYKSLFTIYCILGNIIMNITSVDILTTEHSFIYEKFVKKISLVLEIESQCLIKLKQI